MKKPKIREEMLGLDVDSKANPTFSGDHTYPLQPLLHNTEMIPHGEAGGAKVEIGRPRRGGTGKWRKGYASLLPRTAEPERSEKK